MLRAKDKHVSPIAIASLGILARTYMFPISLI